MDDSSQSYSRPDDSGSVTRGLESWLRIVCQVVGLVLVIAGAYYLLGLLGRVMGFISDPAQFERAVAGYIQAMGAEDFVVRFDGEEYEVGRPAAVGVLVLLYLLFSSIAGQIVVLGGKLVMGVINERREFAEAMKEVLATYRPK